MHVPYTYPQKYQDTKNSGPARSAVATVAASRIEDTMSHGTTAATELKSCCANRTTPAQQAPKHWYDMMSREALRSTDPSQGPLLCARATQEG